MKPIYTTILRAVLFLWLVILCAWFASHADAAIQRSKSAVYRFRSAHPCPANGSLHGACGGYVVDHVKALGCARSPAELKALDVPSNMQWMTVAAGKAKDRVELKCLWRK